MVEKCFWTKMGRFLLNSKWILLKNWVDFFKIPNQNSYLRIICSFWNMYQRIYMKSAISFYVRLPKQNCFILCLELWNVSNNVLYFSFLHTWHLKKLLFSMLKGRDSPEWNGHFIQCNTSNILFKWFDHGNLWSYSI